MFFVKVAQVVGTQTTQQNKNGADQPPEQNRKCTLSTSESILLRVIGDADGMCKNCINGLVCSFEGQMLSPYTQDRQIYLGKKI